MLVFRFYVYAKGVPPFGSEDPNGETLWMLSFQAERIDDRSDDWF